LISEAGTAFTDIENNGVRMCPYQATSPGVVYPQSVEDTCSNKYSAATIPAKQCTSWQIFLVSCFISVTGCLFLRVAYQPVSTRVVDNSGVRNFF
jgi:hypothetical protein